MKITYVGGTYVPSRGADSVHQMGMCEAIADLGHDLTLIVRPGPERVSDDHAFYGVRKNFEIVKYPRPQIRGWGALVNAWHSGHHVKTHPRPDLLYSREQYGLAASVGTGLPFVFEAHWRPRYALQRELEAWLYRRPNFRRLVVISEALKRIYLEIFPSLPESKILVAHDAANPPLVGERRIPRELTARLQVGYVGGLLYGYGIEIIVALAEAHPDVDFHIVGGQDAAIAEWRSKTSGYRNLTMHGFVEPKRVASKYALFDVVLAPFQRATRSIDWASPMKLFEYMAQEKAIICSDFPVLREIMTDGVEALFVKSDDVGAWSRAIGRLQEGAFRQQLAHAAVERLRREYTWRIRAERVLDGLP